MAGFADLHTHTNASDGVNSPGENVRLAKEAGLAAVAITDHDTLAGIPEAMEAGERYGIIVVPGVEISTVADGKDIHVLGYYIQTDDDQLQQRLEQLRRVRDSRNELMLAKLRELGLEITLEEVLEHRNKVRSSDETVGRPHIADVLIKKGYVSSLAEAFDKYLGTNGAAYVNPPRIRPETGIEWIHDAKGMAILAHPGLYQNDKLVEHLIGCGLDGIEVYHSDHTPEDEAGYRALAGRHGLIVTAGSDYHGSRAGQVFHGPVGSKRIECAVLEALRGGIDREGR